MENDVSILDIYTTGADIDGEEGEVIVQLCGRRKRRRRQYSMGKVNRMDTEKSGSILHLDVSMSPSLSWRRMRMRMRTRKKTEE